MGTVWCVTWAFAPRYSSDPGYQIRDVLATEPAGVSRSRRHDMRPSTAYPEHPRAGCGGDFADPRSFRARADPPGGQSGQSGTYPATCASRRSAALRNLVPH